MKPTPEEIHAFAAQLANLGGQWLAHLKILAAIDPTRAKQIAELLRDELAKLEGN